MKRWYAVAMLAILFFICLSGCGQKKGTVLRWALFDCSVDMTKYQEAVNGNLQEKGINCEIEFVNIPSMYDEHYGEYVAPYWLALEEGDYDLIGGLGTLSYLDMYREAARKEFLLPLDSMLEEREAGKKVKKVYPENIWEAMKVDGNIYGIVTPRLDFHYYLVFNQDYVGKYQLDLEGMSEENLEDCLRQVAQGEWETGNNSFAPIDYLPYPPGTGYEYSPCFFIEFSLSGEKPIASNILYEEAYLDRIRKLTDWQKEGLLALESAAVAKSENFLALTVYSYSPEAAEYEVAQKIGGNARLRAVGMPEMDRLTCCGGGKVGVAAASNHKEEAFDVLAEIYSDAELSNALVYGIEGKDYELADGRAQRTDNSSGEYEKLYFGNSLLTLPDGFDWPDKNRGLYEEVEKLPLSGVAGWAFDCSKVETELNQLNNYFGEHNDFFFGRSSEWEQELAELRKTTEEMGIDRVIEEMNAQLEDREER